MNENLPQKSYDEIMDEQAKQMQMKYGQGKKKKCLIQKESQHFDSADYEKTKNMKKK